MSAAKSVGAEFGSITSRKVLKVTKAGSGAGTVTSSPAGVDCGATCEFSFGEGTAVTLTAASATNSKAVIWSGCDSVLANECKVTMDAAKAVTATFDTTPRPR